MNPLRDRIDARIAAGELAADPAQDRAIAALDGLMARLSRPVVANKGSALGWLFGARPVAQDPEGPRGLYLHGGVGRGKTMLMDEAFALAESLDLPRAKPARRVHFHAFMADVHGRIHEWRQRDDRAAGKGGDDPIPPLADALAREARLLAFDEFAVTDVADAMILARLFTALFSRGVTVIATSNVAPDDLYRNGLNRSFFAPFVELVKQRMVVLHLVSPRDHRMERLSDGTRYLIGPPSTLDPVWADMIGSRTEAPATLRVGSREITFERASGALLRVSFDQLCRTPLGPTDYRAIAARFRTVVLEGVPVMGEADRNAAKRFIALIDTFYDAGQATIIGAEAEPAALYPVTHGTEAFEFARTVSRLTEMASPDWN